MKQPVSLTRRKILATTAAITATSLAGCMGSGGSDSPRLWLQLQNPSLKEYDTRTIDGTFGPINYRTNVILYNDTQVQTAFQNLTLNNFTFTPAKILGTIYIQTDGFGSTLINRATEQIRDQFETALQQEMRQYGVENISRDDTDTSIRRTYTGEVPINKFYGDVDGDGFSDDDSDGDGLSDTDERGGGTDLTATFEDIAGGVEGGFELKVDEEDNTALRGFFWIQPTDTYALVKLEGNETIVMKMGRVEYELEPVCNPDTGDCNDTDPTIHPEIDSKDLLILVPGRGISPDDDDWDPDVDGWRVTDTGISLDTMQISTNSQKPIRR